MAVRALAAGALSGDELIDVAELLHALLRELAERRDTRRRNTRALADRIARLERQLAALPAGERAAAIRERLGLTRSTYYRLRNPNPNWDCHHVEQSPVRESANGRGDDERDERPTTRAARARRA